MKLDDELTKRIEAWLSKPEHTDNADIMDGATMLLQLSRNSVLFQTVASSPKRFAKTVEYELRKFLPMRKRGQTLDEADKEARTILGEIRTAIDGEPQDNETKEDDEKDLPAHGGKRADHDQLPANIKAIWQENAARWKKIKALYNKCLSFDKPCDRDESVQVLKETYYKYKSEFARYDDYVISDADKSDDSSASAKDIANAKSYVSKALKDDKLQSMKSAAFADGAGEKTMESYNEFLSKVQQRVDILIENNEVIGDEIRQKLIDGGVVFPEDEPSEVVEQDTEDNIDKADEQGQEN